MKLIHAALAATILATGAIPLLPPSPADAQVLDSLRQRQSRRQRNNTAVACRIQAATGQAAFDITAAECTALTPVIAAARAGDWVGARAALPAAQAAAQSPDARYLVAKEGLNIGVNASDLALQRTSADAMIASGRAPAVEMPTLLGIQYDAAVQARDYARADQVIGQLTALDPNNVDLIVRRAQLASIRRDPTTALTLYQRAIQARVAAGQPVPADWQQRAVAIAYETRQGGIANSLARDLVTANQTPVNWKQALGIYRELGSPVAGSELDIYRLQRAANALTSEADYIRYADAAQGARVYGEAKAVLEAGLAANAFRSNAGYARESLARINSRLAADRASLAAERIVLLARPVARQAIRLGDAYYGYGDFASAANLYRAAVRAGGDTGAANMRLGAALAMAGQRAEAEAAFRAVTGVRQPLAAYWLLWLSARPQ